MRVGLLALLIAAGCAERGSVVLSLEVPANPALDPFERPLGELRLTVTSDGEPIYTATRINPDRQRGVDFGEVPYADDLRFELIGAATSGRVVAYGRNDLPVARPNGEVLDVRLPVRRPFAYLAGSDGLVAIDSTLQPGDDYARLLDIGGVVTAVAAAADGRDIAVVAGSQLVLVSSSTHELAGGAAVALAGPAQDLAVSVDGRWAAASHREPESGVSVVDLAALRAGASPVASFVPTGLAGDLVIAGDLAWLVQNPLTTFSCAGESTLLPIDLATAAAAEDATPLGALATDLAADPTDGAVFVVTPCRNELLRVDAPGASPVSVVSLDGASAVTVARDRIWLMGHVGDDSNDAHLTLASRPIDGGELEVLHMPTLEERAIALELASEGQDGVIQMTADLAAASDIAVLPDGEHVGILLAAGYITEPAGDDGTGNPVVPQLRMVTYEYQQVQLATGLGAQRLRTSCEISVESNALLQDFECAQAPNQDVLDLDFSSTNLSVLYGSR